MIISLNGLTDVDMPRAFKDITSHILASYVSHIAAYSLKAPSTSSADPVSYADFKQT